MIGKLISVHGRKSSHYNKFNFYKDGHTHFWYNNIADLKQICKMYKLYFNIIKVV